MLPNNPTWGIKPTQGIKKALDLKYLSTASKKSKNTNAGKETERRAINETYSPSITEPDIVWVGPRVEGLVIFCRPWGGTHKKYRVGRLGSALSS